MRHLLMTGASGLLGGQLMARLLRDGRRLAVLVRSTAKASARERVETILAGEEEATGRALPRPVVLEGDLSAPSCGLGKGDMEWVRRSCSAVLHNAASLEFVGADRAGEPWRTNVGGTRALLALAERAGLGEFHHVSTAYVCGLAPGVIPEAPSDGQHGFRNDYEASKHEAEWLVRSARFLDRPTFYRPAVIVGHSQTGATATYHGMMAMLQLMAVIVRSLPADETGFRKVSLRLAMTGAEQRNMVPVDWVAEALARLVPMPEARGRTIHLAPEKPVTIREIIDGASSYLHSGGLEFCGPRKPDDLNDIESFAYGGKGLYEAYEQTDPTFDTGALAELVPDLRCPPIDEAMIHRFLAYGDADRWGKRKRPAPPVEAWAGDLLEALSADGLVALARSVAGGVAASPPAAIGLEVVGLGGGSWTIRRLSTGSAALERGLAADARPYRLGGEELRGRIASIAAAAGHGREQRGQESLEAEAYLRSGA
jgi:thioester reductase-like protein